MELDNENRGKLVPVNATEIINKYRKLNDRINFCFEKNWYHPKEVGFDANFFLMVLKGEKRYLPNNFSVNYRLNYFRRGEKLDKKYLINRMKSNNIYALYTPDVCDPLKFSKDFLLKLIAYNDPSLLKELYSINKKQNEERNYNRWADFKIDISPELINDVNEFKSINNTKNNYGGFKLSKNRQPTNLFYQFQGNRIQDINKINEEHKLVKINQNLTQQLNEVNQSNKNLLNEQQILKQEIFLLQQKMQESGNNTGQGNLIIGDKIEIEGGGLLSGAGNTNLMKKGKIGELVDGNFNERNIKIKLKNKK